jgi:4-hydroxy-tetrahydrodipicolinate synthase
VPRFGRMLTAMASPMRGDRSLDLDAAQRLAAHLVDNGNDGLVVAGTTGESPTLSERETFDLFQAVCDAVGDRADVIAGVGSNDTAGTVSRAQQAEKLGIHGVMVVTPYYNKPSRRGLLEHFGTVATAVDVPTIIYNIPGRTSVELEPETLLELAERHPTIVGVKDAVGDMVKASWLAARMPGHFAIWSGDDKNALPLLAVGGWGLISVAGHLVGNELAEMLRCFESDPRRARELHLQLLPLFTALFVDSNPAPLKAALGIVGLPGGPVRPPLVDVEPDVMGLLRRTLETVGVTEVVT